MEYTHLGRTGLLVSRLCLGTMNFGPFTPEPEAHALMDEALEAGINFFDTANVYGRRIPPVPGLEPGRVGATEEILGRWLAKGKQRRERVVLATKVFGAMEDWPNFRGLSALNIKRSCEASLKRLQTDHIDLYQMHHIDRETPWEEIWQALEQLVQEGKVLYVGSSNFAGWHIARASESARARNFLGLVSEQSLYNLTERTLELEVVPACQEYGLGLLVWSPLAGGLLGGVLAREQEGRRASPRIQGELKAARPQIERYENLCAEIGIQPSEIALAWLLAQPVVTAPIIGPRTSAQLKNALDSLEVRIDDETLRALDAIFPGPGGPAPEAYAW